MIGFHRSSRLVCLLAGLAISTLASTAFAQGATIAGTVKSAWGQALQAANVRIANLNISVGTDVDGVYRITLPPDRVRGQSVSLLVRAIGHKPQTKQITIGAGVQDHDFTLDFDANRVSEVVVTDTARKRLAFTVTNPRAGQDTARTIGRDSTRWVQLGIEPKRSAEKDAAHVFEQHLFPPEFIMQHQTRLKITEAQRNVIVAEITKLQATAIQVQWRVGDEAEKLAELLGRDTVAEADVLAQAERMIMQETAVKRAQLSMLIRIRNTLTLEQRQMLQELRKFRE